MSILRYLIWPFQLLFYFGAIRFRHSFQAQKFEREDLFFLRIRDYPVLIFWTYITLSYLDYLLCQDLEWIHGGLASIYNRDWKIDTYHHCLALIICSTIYVILSLWFIDMYAVHEKNKFFLYNWIYVYSSIECYFYWESLSIYLFQFSLFSPLLYFGYFWTSIFIQWVVDMDEDIEAAEDKKRKAEGREITWADFTFSFSEIFLGGTEANLGETPKAAMDRYFAQQTERIPLPPGVTTYWQYVRYRQFQRIRRVIRLISSYPWVMRQVLTYIGLYFKHKLYKKVRAVGPYSVYNPYWNLQMLNRIVKSTIAAYEEKNKTNINLKYKSDKYLLHRSLMPENLHLWGQESSLFWTEFSKKFKKDTKSIKSKKFSLHLFTTKL